MVADAVDDIAFEMGAGKLLLQPFGVTIDPGCVFELELQGFDGGFEFGEFAIGVIFELDHPAQVGKLFVIFAHEF